jgi:hypothetical protein
MVSKHAAECRLEVEGLRLSAKKFRELKLALEVCKGAARGPGTE